MLQRNCLATGDNEGLVLVFAVEWLQKEESRLPLLIELLSIMRFELLNLTASVESWPDSSSTEHANWCETCGYEVVRGVRLGCEGTVTEICKKELRMLKLASHKIENINMGTHTWENPLKGASKVGAVLKAVMQAHSKLFPHDGPPGRCQKTYKALLHQYEASFHSRVMTVCSMMVADRVKIRFASHQVGNQLKKSHFFQDAPASSKTSSFTISYFLCRVGA